MMEKVNAMLNNELYARFAEVAAENDADPRAVLMSFIKDYIVSGGHPETVVNRWPWNKKS